MSNLLILEEKNTIQINEDGKIFFLQKEVTDPVFLKEFYTNISAKDHYYISQVNSKEFVVEAFDQIYIVNQLEFHQDTIYFSPTEEIKKEIQLSSLKLDDWDRILGKTLDEVPFVLSRKAQEQLFDLCDFDDDSITYNGKKHLTPPFYLTNDNISNPDWWSQKYRSNEKPGWELDSHHPSLENAAATLKLPTSKILVLGAGSSNDAAYFAKLGHIVDAIDFSEEAIRLAKQKYAGIENINWIQEDIFKYDKFEAYDIVFDHTTYCAIPPSRRNDLVKTWHRFLRPKGNVLGVFFSMDKETGPPYGGSEWELHQRMKNKFQFLYWNRLRLSPTYSRFGIEFMVYAQKK